MDWVQLESANGRVALDPQIGNIRQLEFRFEARIITPLHTAHWVDDSALSADSTVPPVEQKLSGDFFCAPFGGGTLDGSPPHGWTANSLWTLQELTGGAMRLVLDRPVMGAEVTKTLRLAPDAPLLYQCHTFVGGAGQVSIAHHPMIRLAGRGVFSTSAKRAILSPDIGLEPDRNCLALGARSTDLTKFPAQAGGVIDLQDVPIGDRHEDFVTMVEAEGNEIGWTAVVREVENDIVFCLKDPAVLPVTMVWHSNGGRDYAPWNGQHRGVLGIEDGCAEGAGGHQASLQPNRTSREGVPTALTLGETTRVAHVIGALPKPAGWGRVADIAVGQGALVLTETGGATYSLPFDTEFLRKEP